MERSERNKKREEEGGREKKVEPRRVREIDEEDD